MNEQELAAELGEPGAQALLRTGSLARLAYNGSDGHPMVVPTGFLWDRGRVYCCTATTAAKVKAIARRPEVALTIDSDDGASRSLLLRGRAGIEVVDGIAPEYLAAAAKSWSGAELAAFAENVRRMYPQMARIAITPAWARFYDFGAGRLPAFLQQLADASQPGS
jgi:nitroimidazol reductase NimA-like FMN-containing flavoprotein (pyridoxamine 5'-phosphate oxidase superfamily)